MAELLLPLQAVLTVDCPKLLDELKNYAITLDERDRRSEQMTPGVLLLTACREIFIDPKNKTNREFIATRDLIEKLADREEEPWATFRRGKQITPEALGNLLRDYGIRPDHRSDKKVRGYYAAAFNDAWKRYLSTDTPPKKIPSNPSGLSKPSKSAGVKKRRFK